MVSRVRRREESSLRRVVCCLRRVERGLWDEVALDEGPVGKLVLGEDLWIEGLVVVVVGVRFGVCFDAADGGWIGVAIGMFVFCEDCELVFKGVLKGDLKGLESAGEGSSRRRFFGGEGAGSEDLMIASRSGRSVESASSSESSIEFSNNRVFGRRLFQTHLLDVWMCACSTDVIPLLSITLITLQRFLQSSLCFLRTASVFPKHSPRKFSNPTQTNPTHHSK